MKLFAPRQAFNRDDLFLHDGFGTDDTRPLRSSIDQNCAGATLSLSAAIFSPSQIKVLAQYRKQAGLRVRINRARAPVYSQVNRGHRDLQTVDRFQEFESVLGK
jgi:hypothetical protein